MTLADFIIRVQWHGNNADIYMRCRHCATTVPVLLNVAGPIETDGRGFTAVADKHSCSAGPSAV